MDHILEQVQSGDFDPIKMFTGNKDKFLEVKTAIESMTNNLPKEVCINFVLTKIIPTVFDKNIDNTVRDEAVDIGLHFLQFVNISTLTTKEQENVFHAIEDTYTKVTGELRDSNYSNWDKLWIFLIKLCSEKLHTKMSLANKLLRIVEVAFRNSTSIEQRLKAYDCWVELINNGSLNMEHMCSAKQIKLLVTPMKAKFSRMPVVIMKRCDTFVYLLEKLQDKATLCLKEFLEFCFGPFDEKNDVEKMRQGRSVPEVCNKSTKVLLEIIGHSHGPAENCLKNDDLHLYKPLINDVNFPNFAEILISSVVECCILLNEWSQDSASNNTIVKCLWQSLLRLVRNSGDDAKKRCCVQINNSLRKLLERSKYNEYLHIIMGFIVDVLIQDEMVDKLKEIIFDVSMNILHRLVVDSCCFNVENIQDFLISCFNDENGSRFDKIASNHFRNNPKCENSILCEIWLKCKIAMVPDNVCNFIWPIRHLQNFKDVEALNSKWTRLYTSECKTETKVIIMQEMEKLFLENPLLSSNIVHFLELISSGESNPTKDFVSKFMRLIELVLTLPNLSNVDVKKLSAVILTYCNQNQHFYKSENNDEALDKLCGCLEHLVAIHKDYTVLAELTTHLQNSQPRNLAKFAKKLMPFLEALMLNEDNSVANSTRKLIELLETKENEPEAIPSTRSLRIMNMANVTPKAKRSEGQTNNLTLFGKDIVKSSPLSLKSNRRTSSPRGNNRVDHKKKKEPIISINEDKSSDYVKIETKVQINVDNLNEHQKEMFTKRREDIPALYQDLTQSQSQDFLQKLNEVKNPSPSKKRKRIDCVENNRGNKVRKTLEAPVSPKKNVNLQEADTETQKSEEDNDITQTLENVPVEASQKIPAEESENATPELVEENMSKTSDVDDKTLMESDQAQKIEQNHVEENMLLQNNEEEKVSSNKKVNKKQKIKESTPEKNIRKSKRSTSQKLRKEIVDAVKRQLERSGNEQMGEEDDEDSITLTPTDHSKIEDSIVEENGHTTNENGEDVDENTEETKSAEQEENVQETSLRKSKRQIKKRSSDDVKNLQRRKKGPEETEHVMSQASQDDFETKEKVKKKQTEKIKENNTVLDSSPRSKKHKRQAKTNDTVDEKHESIEDLLARIDKRIQENRKMEKKQKSTRTPERKKDHGTDLQDGNQNKIIALPAQEPEEINSNKEELKSVKESRFTFPKTKRRLKPSLEPLRIEIVESASENQTILEKPEDVYEFKADDEGVAVEETKKPLKKKKKTMNFNRSDYSKRRKKTKKDIIKDEGYPFHVTADSPVPLSKSPSLRAVPSSQQSETITIVITRSPPESSKEKMSFQMSDISAPTNTTPASPKRRSRRRQSLDALNSQDVIESSQVTPTIDITKRKSSPSKNKPRSLKQTTIEEIIEMLDTPETNKRKTRSSTLQDNEMETSSPSVIQEKNEEATVLSKPQKLRRLSLTETSSQNMKMAKRAKRSRSLDKLDPALEQITFLLTPNTPEVEETAQVNDTLPDTLTCDTLVTEPVIPEPEPIQEADTLTLSPVHSETKDDLPGSPVTCNTPDRTTEFLNNTSDISPISSVAEEITTPVAKPSNEVSNVRVARLLQMVNSNVQVSIEGRRWFGNKHSSPSSSRVRKMKMKKEENLDILTFSREVPSPLTVPSSGILKRKFSNLDEVATPSPKRKRVNFSDPAISEKKIFIKDSEEYSDVDQNTDSTNESSVAADNAEDYNETETKGFLSDLEREEMLVNFKDFCDSNLKDTSVDDSEVKSALRLVLQKLKLPDVVEIISEYFSSDEIQSKSGEQVIDEFVMPLLDNVDVFEGFLPKFFKVVEKLPDEKLQDFIIEITKIFGGKGLSDSINTQLTQKQIEDHIVNLDCDKMNDLIKAYVLKLQNQKRHDFLVDLMSLASNELPANKEFVNCHINILQGFVQRMTD